MKFSTASILLFSLQSASAWTTATRGARTETRLMDTRRSFFGAIASTTTIVAGPWIAYADDDVVVEQQQEEPVLVSEESSKEADVVEVVADKKESTEPENDVVEVVADNAKEEHDEVTLALDAKIEDSIEIVEAAVEEASEDVAKATEETFVAMVDQTKLFQELLDERKSITSDSDMDAFRAKLQEKIAADSSFVQAFESFLDDLTSSSA